MRRILPLLMVISLLALVFPIHTVQAQTYYFSVDRETADVYWQSDGTMRVEYEYVLTNSTSADPMEFIDIGTPTSNYDISSVSASINGKQITDIEPSPYVTGVALGLGSNALAPGATGTVDVIIGVVRDVLYVGDEAGYASGLFSPNWFDKNYIYGKTDLTVRFHLPPGVQTDEPRYHASPSGWPSDAPATGLDNDGRVLYEWTNPNANAYTPYVFGASFPAKYVPSGILQQPTVEPSGGITGGISSDTIFTFCCVGGVFGLIVLIVFASVYSQNRRKLAYLPPKIAIEGHGIKRGLTAVEAAILLETALDRVLTMILFGVIKKGAARVTKEDPLEVESTQPTQEGLRTYETDFLEAMAIKNKRDKQQALQKMTINLVQSVQKKMKGFSLKETKDYYKSIVKQAWDQVETAATPEVKSEKYAENLEWSMLDRDFDDRTRRTFTTGPVFLPPWWISYRPSSAPSASPGRVSSTPTSVTVTHSKGGGVSLPTLPGSSFAASVVTSVQNTAGKLVSNISDFTGGVTKTTNPPPPPSRATSGGRTSSGGRSCACACACACAGCACACAGGGR